MKATRRDGRGFQQILHKMHPGASAETGAARVEGRMACLVAQSSMIGDYSDSFSKPGSSYLWIGAHHHLNREEVSDLIIHLKRWLRTGELIATK